MKDLSNWQSLNIFEHGKCLGSSWKFNSFTTGSIVSSIENVWIKLDNIELKYQFRSTGEKAVNLLGWNVPNEEIGSIPTHWLSYPEPNVSLHYLLGTLYIAFMFVALIGNGLVLWVFTSYVWFDLIWFQWIEKKSDIFHLFLVQNRYARRAMCLW